MTPNLINNELNDKNIFVMVPASDFENLIAKISGMEESLKILTKEKAEISDLITVPQAAKLAGYKTNYFYFLISQNKVPCRRIGGKLRFSRKELIEWMKGKQSNSEEIADNYLMNNKKA